VALMRDNTSSGGWILAYDNAGTLSYRIAGKTYNTGRSTASVRNGWHYIAVTKDGKAVAFYLDGQLAASGRNAPNTGTVMPWHVMHNGTYAQYSQGRVDEIAVYDAALPATTVQQHYKAGRGL
jgi:Concanavalin A-like lectin/glucanases superfamily